MSAAHHLNPHQLRMFMSANEITSQYEILAGDRYTIYDDEPSDPRALSQTRRSHRTDGVSNENEYMGIYNRRSHYSQHPETDDEVWERKLSEADESGLSHNIAAMGVESPIHLGMMGNPARQPRPTIVGGHHRIAVMREEGPDELLPVVHHSDLWSAKQGGKYPYT